MPTPPARNSFPRVLTVAAATVFRMAGLFSLVQLWGLTGSGRLKVIAAPVGSPEVDALNQAGAAQLGTFIHLVLLGGTALLGGALILGVYGLLFPDQKTNLWGRLVSSFSGLFSVGGVAGLWNFLVDPGLYRDVLLRVGHYRFVDVDAIVRKRDYVVESFRAGCEQIYHQNLSHHSEDLVLFHRDLAAAVAAHRGGLTDFSVTSKGLVSHLEDNTVAVANFMGSWIGDHPPPRSTWGWLFATGDWLACYSGQLALVIGVGSVAWGTYSYFFGYQIDLIGELRKSLTLTQETLKVLQISSANVHAQLINLQGQMIELLPVVRNMEVDNLEHTEKLGFLLRTTGNNVRHIKLQAGRLEFLADTCRALENVSNSHTRRLNHFGEQFSNLTAPPSRKD